MTIETEAPKSMDELMSGLLVTKEPGAKAPGASDNKRSAPAREPVEAELDDTLEPGEADEGDGEDVWNSADEAEDALLGTEQSEGDAEDESGESGDEGEDDGQGDNKEPFYTVKGKDGKDERVSLSELRAGYQRQADYTQKTQEVATRRAQAEAEFTAATKSRGAYDELLKDLQTRVEGQLTARKPEDWERLKAEDPVTYAAEWADYQRKADARNTIVTERKRVADEQVVENNKKLREFIDGERTKLFDKVPEWRDPAKFEPALKSLWAFVGKQYGYSEQELKSAFDHRVYLMARDAQRYRALVSKQAAGKQKLDTAPAVPPRGRTPQKSAKTKRTEEATKRFHRTGKIDDAIALIVGR